MGNFTFIVTCVVVSILVPLEKVKNKDFNVASMLRIGAGVVGAYVGTVVGCAVPPSIIGDLVGARLGCLEDRLDGSEEGWLDGRLDGSEEDWLDGRLDGSEEGCGETLWLVCDTQKPIEVETSRVLETYQMIG